MRKVYIDYVGVGGEAPCYPTDHRWKAQVLHQGGRLAPAERTVKGVRVPMLTTMLDTILTKAEKADPEADIVIPWSRGRTFKKNEIFVGLLIRARRRESR